MRRLLKPPSAPQHHSRDCIAEVDGIRGHPAVPHEYPASGTEDAQYHAAGASSPRSQCASEDDYVHWPWAQRYDLPFRLLDLESHDSGKDKGNDVIIPAQLVSRQVRFLLAQRIPVSTACWSWTLSVAPFM